MAEMLLTHGVSDRLGKLCRCSRCGKVERCAPTTDFYTRSQDGDSGPLYCESCLLADRRERGVNVQTDTPILHRLFEVDGEGVDGVRLYFDARVDGALVAQMREGEERTFGAHTVRRIR